MTDMTRRTVGRRQAVGRRRVVDTDSASAADSIFAATARLLARQSFAEISVAQILTEAKVSRATFYFYFASKFSVLSGLLERAMDDIFETVQPFLARSGEDSPTVALQRSIRAVTQAWHRHRPVLQAANHHWNSEPELRDLWLAIAERFIASVRREPIDATLWPDIAVVPRNPLRGAIAKRIFRRAANRIPLRVQEGEKTYGGGDDLAPIMTLVNPSSMQSLQSSKVSP